MDCFPADPKDGAVGIAEAALGQARKGFYDVFIVDTAGRLHIDSEMMDEVKRLHAVLNPIETLFVVDSMTGQDAATTARAFHEALPLTGVILTKADGDARGGAALSVRFITGQPIKFVGMGEKTHALEPFYPDRIASRILGMGDVLGLIEEVERHVDRQEAGKLAERLKKGQGFDLEDFRVQLKQMRGMGGIGGLMSKLPGVSDLPKPVQDRVDDKELVRLEGDHRFDDPRRAPFPRCHQGLAQAPHLRGLRHRGPGREPPAQAIYPDPEDHEKRLEERRPPEAHARHGRALCRGCRIERAASIGGGHAAMGALCHLP